MNGSPAAPYLELAEERPLFLSEILKSNDWISCSDAHTFCPTDGEWFYRSQVTTDYAVSMMLTPLSQQSEVRRFYDVPKSPSTSPGPAITAAFSILAFIL